ncbi:MAG: METTL5 family protein [Candidatus Thermoplasmatota archaeon]|nr:METTL5 family protein [Candidatus Thermoplasmatota archaeon]
MRQKELEMTLQKVPIFRDPSPNLEQYITPANIAADIIFTAYQFGNIENKIVLDLGCGTGIFSVGIFLVGAKKVIGIDVDKDCIDVAKEFAGKNNLEIEFLIQDVNNISLKCNTVVMNPPFGAQKSNQKADRKFIEKGFEVAHVIYSLHLSKTIPFIDKMVKSLKGRIDYSKDYVFPMKSTHSFHEKKVVNYDVTLLRIITKT